MKKLLAPLLLVACSSAFALDFEAAIGYSKFDQNNGIFYYESQPHENKMTSPSVQLGIAWQAYGQRFRAGYWYVGHVTQHSMLYAAGPNVVNGSCSGGPGCGREDWWKGRGTAQTLYLQWEPSYRIGEWRLFADIGPQLVKARYQETEAVYLNGQQYSIDGPQEYKVKWNGYAVGIERGNVAIVYSHQPLSSSSDCTFYTKADTISLRVRF